MDAVRHGFQLFHSQSIFWLSTLSFSGSKARIGVFGLLIQGNSQRQIWLAALPITRIENPIRELGMAIQ